MRVKATGVAIFKSNGKKFEVHADHLVWDQEGHERDMGAEISHVSFEDVDGQTVQWTINEYPEGAEASRQTEYGTLQLVQDISFELVHEPDNSDPEDEGRDALLSDSDRSQLVSWIEHGLERVIGGGSRDDFTADLMKIVEAIDEGRISEVQHRSRS